jgi:hypothetical protein
VKIGEFPGQARNEGCRVGVRIQKFRECVVEEHPTRIEMLTLRDHVAMAAGSADAKSSRNARSSLRVCGYLRREPRIKVFKVS